MSSSGNIEKLLRGLKRSKGRFSPFLARYSYVSQRDRLIESFRASFPGVLKVLALDESVTQIYTTVRKYLEGKELDVLMVCGWESLRDINELLVAMGYVREEFRKHCPLPIVFWVDGNVSRKFIRLIPDFYNWVSLTVFESANDELIDFIQQTSENVYQKVLESGVGIFLDYTDLGLPESSYQDLLEARQELANRGITLEAELEGSLEFVLGRLTDDFEETARDHYQRSLELWQQLNNLLRVAHTYYYLGLWWQSYGVTHRAEKNRADENAGSYFKLSVEGFEAINRLDLVAKFINGWGEVLQVLESWDKLETVANRAIEVLDTSQPSFRLARAYDFLAECELAKGNYKQAKQLAETAIEIFNNTQSAASVLTSEKDQKTLDREKYYHRGRYLFSLAKAEKGSGKIKSAIDTLEKAKKRTKPEYNPDFYINIIEKLREIYYQEKEYLKAFKLKQERQIIEQLFGFIAFVGAKTLGSIKSNIHLALPYLKPNNNQQKITQEIAASGREFDVKILLERLSQPQHKLIVLYGESGVGKSSTLQAGLIPVLEKKSIDTRDVVVVLQRVYVNWICQLGKGLAKQLETTKNLAVNSEKLTSIEGIFAQLKKNEQLNLLTVIIFDQFEEFFFVNRELQDRREFAQFLQNCLEIPFVTIILSLRKDYIHYLLDFSRWANLEVINENILDKNILYYLGNLRPSQAKIVIEKLTANSQFKIDSALTEKLVENLAQELGEVRPIELQVVGAQLQEDQITTLAKYQELGNIPQVELVERSLKSVVKDCGEENEKFAWLVLWLLTDENNTRPLKTQAELVKESDFNPEKLELVLNIFVGSGLVFLLPEKPAARYQLVHDYLVWFIRQRKGNKIQEELKQEREKRQQLQTWLVRGSVAVSLVMAILVGAIYMSVREEHKEKIISQANESRALSISGQRWDGLMTAMNVRQKQIDAKIKPIGKASKITNALRVAVYSYDKDDEFREINRTQAHENWVNGIAFSPDEETIASGSYDNTMKLWNHQGNSLQTLKGHENSVNGMAFSPDGGTVKLWNHQGKLLQTLKGHENSVYGIAFSFDGETIATAGADKTVKLWNPQGKLLQTITGHDNWVYGIAFSPDGETIASASWKTVKLWNRQGKLLQTLTGHDNWVYGVAFSPDGKTIATAGGDKTVKLWSPQGNLLQTIIGHENWVYGVAFSPDGKTIATASGDKTVKLWNRQGKLLQTLKGHDNWVYGVAFSPDKETIATASGDKTVKLWNRQGNLLQTLTGHENSVYGVAFSPDGNTIATASGDQTVKLWTNWRIEDLTKHGCERLNNYLVAHPQKLEELKICQTDERKKLAASSWVIEGEKLAREGKVKVAVAAFKKAAKWNSDLNLNSNFLVWAKLLAEAETLMEEGTELAREEKIEAAMEKYQRAKELDQVAFTPTWQNVDPEAKAKYQAVDALLNKGDELLREGKVKEAIASYEKAERIDSTQISAFNWNKLCRDGSLDQKAADVMFACEKAVAMSPQDGKIIDSRGLARALTGNIEGAIADFLVYVEWTRNEEKKAQRQQWIKALQAGENPFTDKLLEELR